jgi:glycerol-3-phosphate cytidylyltransferase-like family protein
MTSDFGVTCGYLDPSHRGHFECIKSSTEIGRTIVIMNSDEQVIKKYGYVMFPMDERIARIIRKVPSVTGFVISVDKDSTQAETIRLLRPRWLYKDGDRNKSNMPLKELKSCKDVGCEVIYGKGKKVCSSTDIRERIERMRQNVKAR